MREAASLPAGLGPAGGGGWLRAFDPRLRVATAVATAVVVVAGQSLPVLAAAFVVAMVLASLAGLGIVATARRMVAMDLFMVPLLLFLPFTVPGVAIAEIGPLVASREGGLRAIEIVLTANTVVLVLLALVGTLEPVVLGHALARLRVPAKLVHLLLFTVRYVETLRREYGRLRLAMRARGFRPRGDRHTWRSFGWLFGMLLVRAFERAERILEAMRCRGFAGRYHALDDIRWRPADWLGSAAAAFALGLFVVAGALR